ncbi:MAG: DUF2335 domain-containing protein [Bacteroidetes bacterium]|nr:MAG: DUF2335 domain-containing protein [Bacteroidota bacterium]
MKKRPKKKKKLQSNHNIAKNPVAIQEPDKQNGHNTITRNGQEDKNTEIIAAAYSFSGPLPPPEILKKYNETIPDGANRIMIMTENQIKYSYNQMKRGQVFAFIITILIIIIGGYLIHEERGWYGFSIIIADIIMLITAFLKSGNIKTEPATIKENEENNNSE